MSILWLDHEKANQISDGGSWGPPFPAPTTPVDQERLSGENGIRVENWNGGQESWEGGLQRVLGGRNCTYWRTGGWARCTRRCWDRLTPAEHTRWMGHQRRLEKLAEKTCLKKFRLVFILDWKIYCCPFKTIIKKKQPATFLFEKLRYRRRGRFRGSDFIYWFTSQVTRGCGPQHSQEPGRTPGKPGASTCARSLAAFSLLL